VTTAAIVARVAVRELWMTFRLLIVLVTFVGGSAVVVLLPAAPAVTLDRLAVGLGIATVVSAAVSAWSLADERASGRAGWLITRSVSRGTYLLGWLLGMTAVGVAGVVGAAALGWLTIAGLAVDLDLVAYAAAVVAVATSVAAAITLGLAVGALLGPPAAAAVAAVLCAGAGILVVIASAGSSSVPGAAYLLLSRLVSSDAVVPDALRAAGVGLVQTAILFVIARAAMERAEL
jgi:hypothetical protein